MWAGWIPEPRDQLTGHSLFAQCQPRTASYRRLLGTVRLGFCFLFFSLREKKIN